MAERNTSNSNPLDEPLPYTLLPPLSPSHANSSGTSHAPFTPRSSSFPDHDSDSEFDEHEPTPVHSPGGPHYEDLPPSYEDVQREISRGSGGTHPSASDLQVNRLVIDDTGPVHANPNSINSQPSQSPQDTQAPRSPTANADPFSTLLNASLHFTCAEPDPDVRYAPRLTSRIAIPPLATDENALQIARAYAKPLHPHSITPAQFAAFIDSLNTLLSINPEYLREDQDITESYLAAANEAFFNPRGLRVRLSTLQALVSAFTVHGPGKRKDQLLLKAASNRTAREKAAALDSYTTTLIWDIPSPSTENLHLSTMATTLFSSQPQPFPPTTTSSSSDYPNEEASHHSSDSRTRGSDTAGPSQPPNRQQTWEEWGNQIGARWEAWGKNFGKRMEEWGQDVGRRGEAFGRRCEGWGDGVSAGPSGPWGIRRGLHGPHGPHGSPRGAPWAQGGPSRGGPWNRGGPGHWGRGGCGAGNRAGGPWGWTPPTVNVPPPEVHVHVPPPFVPAPFSGVVPGMVRPPPPPIPGVPPAPPFSGVVPGVVRPPPPPIPGTPPAPLVPGQWPNEKGSNSPPGAAPDYTRHATAAEDFDDEDDGSDSDSDSESEIDADEPEHTFIKKIGSIEKRYASDVATKKLTPEAAEKNKHKAFQDAEAERTKAQVRIEGRLKSRQIRKEMRRARRQINDSYHTAFRTLKDAHESGGMDERTYKARREALKKEKSMKKEERRRQKAYMKAEWRDWKEEGKGGARERRRGKWAERSDRKVERRARRRGFGGEEGDGEQWWLVVENLGD